MLSERDGGSGAALVIRVPQAVLILCSSTLFYSSRKSIRSYICVVLNGKISPDCNENYMAVFGILIEILVMVVFIFEPTCATCTMGCYASLSVCLSVCLSVFTQATLCTTTMVLTAIELVD